MAIPPLATKYMTARIESWHAHVYFDAQTRDAAWALRESIASAFGARVPLGRFHERPVGPHPMWSHQLMIARALFAATDALGLTGTLTTLLEAACVVVRGPKPTAALRARGVRIDRAAGDPFTTREVVAELADVPVDGRRVVVQRYGDANPDLDA